LGTQKQQGKLLTRSTRVVLGAARRMHVGLTISTALVERVNLTGLATEIEFKCRLSQYVLADAIGLSAIHVNRVLRRLREQDLLTLRKGSVKIHDLDRLRKLAGFRGRYLNARHYTTSERPIPLSWSQRSSPSLARSSRILAEKRSVPSNH
jgi:hypothetical protein